MEFILNSLMSVCKGRRLKNCVAKCKRYQEVKKGGKEIEKFSEKNKGVKGILGALGSIMKILT